MRTVRLTLCWIYALAAFIFLRTSVYTYRQIFLFHFPDSGPNVLGMAAPLSLPALGVVYGIAWWTILLRKPSGRIWTFVVSSVQTVLVGIFFYHELRNFWEPVLVLLAISAAGFIAFWRPDNSGTKDNQSARLRISGDGTNPFLDKFVWIASSAASIGIIIWWLNWGSSRGLVEYSDWAFFIELYAALLLAVAIHEAGHAIAGKICGMKLIRFAVGPLNSHLDYGKWRFNFQPRGLFSFSGFTLTVPVMFKDFRERKIAQVAAGPFANLITGLIAVCAAFMAPGRHWGRSWEVSSYFATISLVTSMSSLVPYRIKKTGYSDGAKIYQLVSGRLWADYHRSLAIAYSSLVSNLRPRDFDIETMQRAAGTLALGINELMLHLYAYSHYFDLGEFLQASNALGQAELVYDTAKLELPAELHIPFIFGSALLRRDPVNTRLWWDRLEAQKTKCPADIRWLPYSAFLWMEKRGEEAREAWKKADAWAQQLPNSGAYEAERNGVTLLGLAIQESSEPGHHFDALVTSPRTEKTPIYQPV